MYSWYLLAIRTLEQALRDPCSSDTSPLAHVHFQGEELIPSGGGGGKLKSIKLANSLPPLSALSPFDIVLNPKSTSPDELHGGRGRGELEIVRACVSWNCGFLIKLGFGAVGGEVGGEYSSASVSSAGMAKCGDD